MNNKYVSYIIHWDVKMLCLGILLFKAALATILTKRIMFWKLVNSFKMMK
jgi:hypothetical protein